MTRFLVRELSDHLDEKVTICGWVNATRLQRKMQFLIARDHTGLVQVTHPRSSKGGEPDPLEIIIDGLTNESAIVVTGQVVANPIVNLNGLELVPTSIEVLSRAESPLPIDEYTSIDQRLDWRFLDLRRPSQNLVFEVQATMEMAMREIARREGFTEIHTPKLMPTASESGAEVFEVKYFDRTAYLAQSPQFYKQMAIAGGIDRVLEVGPVFRAEPSFTARHATEFTGVDVEMAWIHGVEDVTAFEEQTARPRLCDGRCTPWRPHQAATRHGNRRAHPAISSDDDGRGDRAAADGWLGPQR